MFARWGYGKVDTARVFLAQLSLEGDDSTDAGNHARRQQNGVQFCQTRCEIDG